MSGCTCGCCAGLTIETPVGISNAQGLDAIAYRVGDWGTVKATMLSRLSSSDFPALSGLTTRGDDDFTNALGDAFSTMADVVTFYQERIANESYLRTATQFNSTLQLAKLIGYQPAPGVAASVALAFTMQAAPGQPSMASQPSVVAVGTRAQSNPDPGQTPQTFETIGQITARLEWNAMPAQTGVAVPIVSGLTQLYLAGTATQLSPGDAILIVGSEREATPSSERWDVRWIEQVQTDSTRNLTQVSWSEGLGGGWGMPSTQGAKVYALRQRASLFGYNAPDSRLMHIPKSAVGTIVDSNDNWLNYTIDATGQKVDLDSAYSKIVKGGWIALAGGDDKWSPLIGYVALYKINGVTQTPRRDFGVSAKVTRLTFDTANDLSKFRLASAQALGQSEPLAVTQRPLLYPCYGSTLTLGQVQPNLLPGQWIAVSGKRQRVMLGPDVSSVSFVNDPSRTPAAGDSFQMLAAPEQTIGGTVSIVLQEQLDPSALPPGPLTWTLLDRDGTKVTLIADVTATQLQPALSGDPTLSEAAIIASGADGITLGLDTTALTLVSPLVNCYDRLTVAVNANVAPATHGQTVGEFGGSGDASVGGQTFALKQSPLTYVTDTSSPTGASPTLIAQIDGLAWSAVPTLYSAGPTDRVYALSQDSNNVTTVQFGDGVKGARLSSGQNNVRFQYRVGLGVAGNLRSGQISSLLTRPAGVTSVVNPTPSAGGQDPESIGDTRANAPMHVRTLDRAISISDYADYAAIFAGVAKASAIWIPSGPARGVHVTIAGPGGETFEPTDPTVTALIASLRTFGDSTLPIFVESYSAPTFTLIASLKLVAGADADTVTAAVQAALASAYAFDSMDFGEPVTLDGVYATMQSASGVLAVDIQQLFRLDTGPGSNQPAGRLLAARPTLQPDGTVSQAEILTLNATPPQLGTMP
jgi:predicted phage baseplate assembly protein